MKKNNHKSIIKLSFLFFLLFPAVTLAQVGGLSSVLITLISIINRAIPVMLGIGLIVFFIGILRYSFSSNETVRSESRGLMVYGIVALFVMVSVWGLVNLLGTLFAPSFSSDPGNINYKPINVRSLIP